MDIIGANITKEYEGKKIISDYNFCIKEGAITCIMGPSGSGKTTLLKMLMGLVKPDSGTITGINDRRIAVVFQEDRLIEHSSVLKNIKLVTENKLSLRDIKTALKRVSLENKEKVRVSKLSGGMKRRVVILRALLADSDTVYMDEPLKGLDQDLKDQMIAYIKEMTKTKTLVIVTHDPLEAEAFGAEVLNVSLIN